MKKFMFSLLCMVFVASYALPTLSESEFERTPYGAWDLETAPTKVPQLSLGIKLKNGNFLQFHMGYLGDTGKLVVAGLIAPTAVKEKSVTITFPDGTEGVLKIVTCNQEYCEFFSESIIARFKTNSHGTLSYTDRQMGDITFDFPLKGFNEGFAAWEKAVKPYQPKSGTIPVQSHLSFDQEHSAEGVKKNVFIVLETKIKNATIETASSSNPRESWLMYYFSPLADVNKGVTVTFPDGTKRKLPITACSKISCQALENKAEIQDTLQHMEALNKQHPKKPFLLTFFDKETNEDVSMAFFFDGYNVDETLKKFQQQQGK